MTNWLEQALKGPLARPINRFATIRLSHEHIPDSCLTDELSDEEREALWSEWSKQNARIRHSERFDLLLEWAADFLDKVTIPDRPYTTLYDELKIRIATTFPDEGIHHADHVKLILGDLSGIQSYLFSIAHIGEGGVAKKLRSRSFHLSLLAKTAAFCILDRLGLSYRHLIMSAGGVFLLAVRPEDNLATIALELERELYVQYHGSLQLHLAETVVPLERLSAVSQAVGQLHSNVRLSKMRPAKHLLQQSTNGKWNVQIWVHERAPGTYCSSCGRHPAASSDGTLCQYCVQDEQTGMLLPRSIAMWIGPIAQQTCGEPIGVMWGRYEIRLLGDKDLHEAANNQGYLELWQGAPQFSLEKATNCWIQKAYVSNHIPRQNGIPMHFLHLAELAEGKHMLGVCKADVDRLGLLLSYGLRSLNGDYSLSEYLTASRNLERFFGERLTVQLRDKFPNLYTVFSGGDDLFLIGPWSEIPNFAQWMREEFRRFVHDNPDVTLSAGILIVSPRTPIATMARHAEHELELAKESASPLREVLGDGEEGRDQVSLFGRPMEWRDFEIIWKRAKQWADWADSGVASNQFFRKLLDLAAMRDAYIMENKVEGLKYVAMLKYTIQRMQEESSLPVSLREQRDKMLRWANSLLSLQDTDASRDWYLMPVVYRLFELYRTKEGVV